MYGLLQFANLGATIPKHEVVDSALAIEEWDSTCDAAGSGVPRESSANGRYAIVVVAARSQTEPNRAFIQAVLEQAMTRIKASSRPETWDCFRPQVLDLIPATQVAATLGRTENSVFLNAARVMRKLRESCAEYLEEFGNDGERPLPFRS